MGRRVRRGSTADGSTRMLLQYRLHRDAKNAPKQRLYHASGLRNRKGFRLPAETSAINPVRKPRQDLLPSSVASLETVRFNISLTAQAYSFSHKMDYFFCGIVAARNLQDATGTPCGHPAKTLCYDCGTSLCSLHTERCDLCSENFCMTCSSFHRDEHAKPSSGDRPTSWPHKKSA